MTAHVDEETALIPHLPRGHSEIDRRTRSTTIVNAQRGDHAMAHPLLASTAIVTADWSGRVALHGGAFVAPDGRAWGVLGDRGAGKSSLVGWCVKNGLPVITDDIVVTDGAQVLAGPRCLDLRAGAAKHFGLGIDIGVVGRRRRWRVRTDMCEPAYPLGGWIVPRWSSEIWIDDAAVADRAAVISPHRAIFVRQQHPVAWMGVLAKRLIHFARPQSWARIDVAMGELMSEIATSVTAQAGATH
ncbi:hypothetical protein [uncultured Williamsia sp.]|uniref:hypothetical protein n=1 Tax=uncultured Williamsia sp. TaxID=259311 RepID=UPI0026292DA8|nr:hypothetical protein [uncultured Williamsia sp.]